MTWYLLLIVAVAVERLAEVVVAERNRTVSQQHGGIEFGAGTLPGDGRTPHGPARGMSARAGRVAPPVYPGAGLADVVDRAGGTSPALVVHHHVGLPVEHPGDRDTGCERASPVARIACCLTRTTSR